MKRFGVSMQCMVLALTTLASAEAPRGPGEFDGGPRRMPRFGRGDRPASNLSLLEIGEVLDELGATDAQRTAIEGLITQAQEAMRTTLESFDFTGIRTLSREERDKRFREAVAKGEEASAKVEGKLADVLTAAQLERLTQVRLQREGLAALMRPDVAKRLGLSESQQEQILKINEGSRSRLEGFGQPDFSRFEQDRAKRLAEGEALLTDEQKAAWAAMKGKPFTFPEPRFRFGPPGRGGFGGPGGPGGPGRGKRQVVEEFDKDGDGRLNKEERAAARQSLRTGGQRGPGRGRMNATPPASGARLTPADVPRYIDAGLYDPNVLRTIFLDFENEDWEEELADFHGTDVDVPATLTVDGKTYTDVGVHFRGMSSYMMVPAGYKRSLNVSIDHAIRSQRLYGYKTLNLLNSHGDPSFLSTVLYAHIARKYLPTPKANFVKVVINGTSWGIYVNVQQFDKIFLAENHTSYAGSRWKVPGSPGATGGLEYLGDTIEDYKRHYTIKTRDAEEAWRGLIGLCKALNETPLGDLEAALKPILDLDGVLWFLAIEVVLVNSDGYWTRASDYSLFLDRQGMFHLSPYDFNEAFQGGGGPGGPGRGRDGPPGGFGPPDAMFFDGPPPVDMRDTGGDGPEEDVPGLFQDEDPQGRRPGRDRGEWRRGWGEDRGPGGRFGGRGPGGRGGGRGPGGRGGAGMGPRGGGVALDPLVGIDSTRIPLRSRLLKVPGLRKQYLHHVRTIARDWLDWDRLGLLVARYRSFLEKEIEADTRKLDSYAAFQRAVGEDGKPAGTTRGRGMSLKAFAEQRRAYLLSYPLITPPSTMEDREKE